jgi:hypothetical protein
VIGRGDIAAAFTSQRCEREALGFGDGADWDDWFVREGIDPEGLRSVGRLVAAILGESSDATLVGVYVHAFAAGWIAHRDRRLP